MVSYKIDNLIFLKPQKEILKYNENKNKKRKYLVKFDKTINITKMYNITVYGLDRNEFGNVSERFDLHYKCINLEDFTNRIKLYDIYAYMTVVLSKTENKLIIWFDENNLKLMKPIDNFKFYDIIKL